MSKMQQAQSSHRAGRLDDARALCEDALREAPGCVEMLSLLALIAVQQGDFALSVAGYDRVISVNPGLADAYSNRGAALAAMNRWDEALANFDQAIALRPDHAGAHFCRAILWLLQGDFVRGWAEYEWRLAHELDFVETAALCECLDLMISVDTSIAHLSAALGQKTWILLPYNPDCRWLLDRDDSPWYPSARLYRQARGGDMITLDGRLLPQVLDFTESFEFLAWVRFPSPAPLPG